MAISAHPEPQPNEPLPPATDYADCSEEAERRSIAYRDKDPFPDIPKALLSSEHITAYVRETGMLFPFEPTDGRLKSASYEAKASGRFIYWDGGGKKIAQAIEKDGTFTLRANSIGFVEIATTFRLPQYIAVRFNLRITHVHRGLLLGTGPLVDPGFSGNLLVPLHNLTAEDYIIRGDDGLIWIEFTKTSHDANPLNDTTTYGEFVKTEDRKSSQPPEYYFDKASKNQPIRSSIPVVVDDAKKLAQEANNAAKRAEQTNRIFVGAGFLAIAGTLVGLFSLFTAVNSNVVAVHSLVENVSSRSLPTGSSALRQPAQNGNSFPESNASETRRTGEEIRQMGRRLDAMRSQIESLRADVRHLKGQSRSR